MSNSETRSPSATLTSGFWSSNPALVQLLGLCPLLAVTTTSAQGLGLGLATLFILVLSNALVSLLRPLTPDHARIPVFVMLIATLVTVIELSMAAWFSELYQTLGIFIPLIVTNCTILARAEAFAYRNKLIPAVVDGFTNGLGFLIALVALGFLRELLGHGSIFRDLDQILGSSFPPGGISIFSDGGPLSLALLPPGAFMTLALLVALHRLTKKTTDS